jgi:pre-rRNA-processing protein TSR4
MAAPEVNNVDLGFVEKVENWKLLSHFFPSKVGGKPAWLSLKLLPSDVELKCRKCKKACVFLAQIYAPDSDHDYSFHRTIFLFLCKDPKCCTRNNNENIRVFRSQLGRVNDFYSAVPPEDDEKFSWNDSSFPSAWDYQDLCQVCGCHGPKKCAKCHEAGFCSREHQIVGWKNGHKEQCAAKTTSGRSRFLKERELLHLSPVKIL